MGKKRKLTEGQVEDLAFDPSARQEYLTGFHKRKLARKESAREQAIKREKEERVKERKTLRDQRKEDLEQHVKAVNEELRKQNAFVNGEDLSDEEEDEEWEGIDEGAVQAQEAEQLPEDEEYVDEDKYTTVTVEAMGDEEEGEDDDDAAEKKAASVAGKETKKKKPWGKGKDGEKPKKKKFRYESKAERQVTRQKQKSKGRAAKARREKG